MTAKERREAWRLAALVRTDIGSYIAAVIRDRIGTAVDWRSGAADESFTVKLNPIAAKRLREVAKFSGATPEETLALMARLAPDIVDLRESVARKVEDRLDEEEEPLTQPEVRELTQEEEVAMSELEALGMSRESLEREALRAVLRCYREHGSVPVPVTVAWRPAA